MNSLHFLSPKVSSLDNLVRMSEHHAFFTEDYIQMDQNLNYFKRIKKIFLASVFVLETAKVVLLLNKKISVTTYAISSCASFLFNYFLFVFYNKKIHTITNNKKVYFQATVLDIYSGIANIFSTFLKNQLNVVEDEDLYQRLLQPIGFFYDPGLPLDNKISMNGGELQRHAENIKDGMLKIQLESDSNIVESLRKMCAFFAESGIKDH